MTWRIPLNQAYLQWFYTTIMGFGVNTITIHCNKHNTKLCGGHGKASSTKVPRWYTTCFIQSRGVSMPTSPEMPLPSGVAPLLLRSSKVWRLNGSRQFQRGWLRFHFWRLQQKSLELGLLRENKTRSVISCSGNLFVPEIKQFHPFNTSVIHTRDFRSKRKLTWTNHEMPWIWWIWKAAKFCWRNSSNLSRCSMDHPWKVIGASFFWK